jgi:4-amino-4-deoxy-L-arabinose transferase-like glycosyltransferase
VNNSGPMRAATLAAVAFALANAGWSAWSQGWTYDEPFHLRWTERMLDTAVTERTSVQRFNSKTPATLPNVLLVKAARAAGVQEERALRLAARLPSVGWLVLMLGGVFALARPAFGEDAAMLAVIATALDPNVVAHASLATVDEACAATVVGTLACAAAYARLPSPGRAAALGFALGLALVVKFSALFLLLGLAVVPLVFRAGWPPPRRVAGHLVGMTAVAWLVVASWYLFLGIGAPLRETVWRSAPFQTLAAAAPGLPAPLPAAFLTGVDRSLADERGEWDVVVLGRRYPRGVWFYFAFLWLVKTPLLILIAQAAGYAAAARRLAGHPVARLVAWNLILHLAYFSFVFHAQIGYRYVLMLVPLGYVLAAAGLASPGLTARRRRLLTVAAAVAVAENAAFFGNPLSFTNAAVWPKRLAYRLVADSNIDWGQGREGIRERIARAGAGHTILDPLHILPGHNTLDLNAVAGVFDFEQHRWLREHMVPGGHFGHTYLWYEVGNDAFDRFLDDARRLRPEPWVTTPCPPDLPLEHQPPGARVGFALDTPPRAGDGWSVCVETRRGVDFGFRLLKGIVRFGRLDAGGACVADAMVPGQVSWFRLDPGRHALCVVEIPNRRAWLPYAVEGTWLVRGRAAALGLRRLSFSAPAPPPPESTTPRSSSPPPPPGG